MKMRWTTILAASLLVGAVACGDDDPKSNNQSSNNQSSNNQTTNNQTTNNQTTNNQTTNNQTTNNQTTNNSSMGPDVTEVEPNGFGENDTPTPFDLGQSVGGTIAEGSGDTADFDRFAFTASAGDVVTVSIVSQGDGLLDLGESQIGVGVADEEGSFFRVLAGNENLTSREVFIPADGTYTVEVFDLRYEEMVVGGDDATYVIGTSVSSLAPEALAVPGSVDGDLGDGTISSYTVNVAEASAVTAETFAGRLDTPSGVDTVLYVFDPAASAVVATNDDIDLESEIYDSATTFAAEANTDYIVVVDGFNATESGDFRLEVDTTDDSPDAPTVVAAGDSVMGDIAAAEGDEFDTDYFEITLQRNEIVRIEVQADDQLEPNIRVLFDGFVFAEGRPSDAGVAAVEIAAGDFEDPQTFAITVDDFRNTPPDEGAPANVGGAGFGYTLSVTTTTWTPTAVTLPYSDNGTIDTVGTTDWFEFTVPAGDVLIADVITTATDFIPQLVQLNESNFDVPVEAPFIVGSAEDTTYTIGVRDEFFRGFATADYLVDFSTVTPVATTETEDNDTVADANAITAPAAVTGVTEGTDDSTFESDYFSFSAVAGQTVSIFTAPGTDAGTDDADTVLTLLDSAEMELASNDDGSFGNTFSAITFEIPADGTYYIKLDPYCGMDSCSNGDYTMTFVTY